MGRLVNNRRLLEPIGNIPPAEAEARYYAQSDEFAMVASLKPKCLRQTRGGSRNRFLPTPYRNRNTIKRVFRRLGSIRRVAIRCAGLAMPVPFAVCITAVVIYYPGAKYRA
jgi:hypothetical protein